MRCQGEAGYSLLEVLIASALIGSVAVGLSEAQLQSLYQAKQAQNTLRAQLFMYSYREGLASTASTTQPTSWRKLEQLTQDQLPNYLLLYCHQGDDCRTDLPVEIRPREIERER